MDTEDLHILKTLGEELNITTAAQRLFITQPALTYRLKGIEKELGAALFTRQAKGLEPTPAGKVALAYAVSFGQGYTELKERIAEVSGRRYFSLHMAVSPAFVKYRLPTFLGNFAKKNPDVDIFVESHNSTRCLDLLREKKVNLAIIRGKHLWNGGSVYLGSDAICLVSNEKTKLEELPGMPYIAYLSDPGLNQTISEWWEEYFKVPPRIIMHINDSDACRQFVAEGLGYSILPSNIHADGKFPHLHVAPLYHVGGEPLVRTSWVKFYKSAIHNPVIAAFIDSLVEFMKWKDDA